MKKVVSVLLLFSVLLCLSGCKKDGVTPQLKGISFTADITYYNENYKGDCTVDENGTLRLKVLEPETLCDYVVTLNGDSMTAEYMGITFTPSNSNLPFSSVSGGVYNVLCSVSGDTVADKSGDEYLIKGGSGAGAYTLYISPTGLPQRLLMPDERFSVYFYDVTLI